MLNRRDIMNFIFLDVDGVLNWYNTYFEDDTHTRLREVPLDDECIKNLKKLTEQFECQIILSSSWRRGLNDDLTPRYSDGNCAALIAKLNEFGMSLCGKTPTIDSDTEWYWTRGTEIVQYLRANAKAGDNFVVLDDDNVVKDATAIPRGILRKHFVHTDFMNGGFNEKALNKAIEILNDKTDLWRGLLK